jgi:hypothetical protein
VVDAQFTVKLGVTTWIVCVVMIICMETMFWHWNYAKNRYLTSPIDIGAIFDNPFYMGLPGNELGMKWSPTGTHFSLWKYLESKYEICSMCCHWNWLFGCYERVFGVKNLADSSVGWIFCISFNW